MPLRPPAGFILPGYNPLKVPDAPTLTSASAGEEQLTVEFTAPANTGGGAITSYGVVAKKTSDGTTVSATGSASPITVTGLTNGSAYTAAVWALNLFGPSPFSGFSGSVTPDLTRALYAGGFDSGSNPTNVIGYITINNGSNAVDFGDLSVNNRAGLASCSSSTRGIFAGGTDGGSTYTNVIDYVTIVSAGNATDFGDLNGVTTPAGSGTGLFSGSGFGNQTRGIFGRAKVRSDANAVNAMSYLTISTTGNTVSFGELLSANTSGQSASSSSTRGVIMLANGTNTINYVTIATTGNATDFGDLISTGSSSGSASASSSTRALFALGADNTINYITIATTGNATDFGDLTVPRQSLGATSGKTKAVFVGGYNPTVAPASAITNVIDTVTIASAGNATDFGDLTQVTYYLAACSNGHGGLA